VAPLLIFMLIGIINFGFIFSEQQTLNASSRDAARQAVVEPSSGSALTCQGVVDAARGTASTIGMAPANVQVTVKGASGATLCLSAATPPIPPNTVDAGDFAAGPCTTSNQKVTVELAFKPSAGIAFAMGQLIFPDINTLKATSSFRCEYP
jgi:Flp pilus assembly protein TadG